MNLTYKSYNFIPKVTQTIYNKIADQSKGVSFPADVREFLQRRIITTARGIFRLDTWGGKYQSG